MYKNAIVRKPGENYANGLTTAELGKPSYPAVLEQHGAYCKALESCELNIKILDPDLDHPDSTFVEDTCVIVKDHAVFTRPGASSRLGEVDRISDAVHNFFSHFHEIIAPGTLDGGDICEADGTFFIGISHRTNLAGGEQLGNIVKKLGFNFEFIDIREIPEVLHLKSGLAYLDRGNLIAIDALYSLPAFEPFQKIRVEPEELYAANCILVNDKVLVPNGFPKLAERISVLGYPILPLEMSEFQKMDGGLSCLSLRF